MSALVSLRRRGIILILSSPSGAGTTTVKTTFENIFRREGVTAAVIEGAVSWPMTRVASSTERSATKQDKAQASNTASPVQRPSVRRRRSGET